jgi:hypothetical protein
MDDAAVDDEKAAESVRKEKAGGKDCKDVRGVIIADCENVDA